MQNIQIVPTVLAETPDEFKRQLDILSPLSERIQIDISDGLLFPDQTVTAAFALRFLADHPVKYENNIFDFHLMEKYWEKTVDMLMEIEQFVTVNLILPHYSVYRPLVSPFNIGVVLSPEDQIDKSLLDRIPALQVMTVAPGKQGGSFLAENLGKIKDARKNGFEREIIIDGGVSDKTMPLIMASSELPDVMGVGSFLTRAKDPKKNYQVLASYLPVNEDKK